MNSSSWKEFAEKEFAEKDQFPDSRVADRNLGETYAGRADSWSREPPPTTAPQRPVEIPLTVRLTTGVAGLLAAGSVVLGIVMVAVMVVLQIRGAPATDLVETKGPGWIRTGVQMGGGIAAEGLYLTARGQSTYPIRVVLGIVATLIALTALWWVWLR